MSKEQYGEYSFKSDHFYLLLLNVLAINVEIEKCIG